MIVSIYDVEADAYAELSMKRSVHGRIISYTGWAFLMYDVRIKPSHVDISFVLLQCVQQVYQNIP